MVAFLTFLGGLATVVIIIVAIIALIGGNYENAYVNVELKGLKDRYIINEQQAITVKIVVGAGSTGEDATVSWKLYKNGKQIDFGHVSTDMYKNVNKKTMSKTKITSSPYTGTDKYTLEWDLHGWADNKWPAWNTEINQPGTDEETTTVYAPPNTSTVVDDDPKVRLG